MTVTQDDALTWTVGDLTYEVKGRLRSHFDPEQPRDRKGRWIETGATVSIWGGGRGTVSRNLGGGYLEIHTPDKRKLRVHRNYLTVTRRPGGAAPSDRPADRPRPLRPGKPSAGVEDFTPDAPDTRVAVSELKPGQVALVYGHDEYGASTSRIGRVANVSPAGPAQDADTKPGTGWAVGFRDDSTNRGHTVYVGEDAVARVVPSEDFDRIVEAERSGDEEAANRLALDIYRKIGDADDAEAGGGAGPGPDAGEGSPPRGAERDRDAPAGPEAPPVAAEPEAAAPAAQITQMSGKPLLANAWGTFAGADSPVNYHDEGAIGQAIRRMGDDAHLDVDGEPLANVLGRLATDAVVGRRTSQEVLDRVKELRSRLPEGSAGRRALDYAVTQMDAPDTPAPAVPEGAPEPLRRLMADLHAVPLVRRDPQETTDLSGMLAGGVQGPSRRLVADVTRLRNRRHESAEGKAEIDRAVTRAVEGLEELRSGSRKAPARGPVNAAAPDPVREPPPPAPKVPAAPSPGSGGKPGPAAGAQAPGTAADVRAGDRVTFQVPITDTNAARFSAGSNPPGVGDVVTVRGVAAGDAEEDMFGGYTVRLTDGARWESGRGIGPLGGEGREFALGQDEAVHKVGVAQARRPAATPGPRAQQNGLFLDPDRAGTEELFDPYADSPAADVPEKAPAASAAPEAPTRAGAGAEEAEARVRAAYAQLVGDAVGDWASLRRMREVLGDMSRDEVDRVLTAMNRLPDVGFAPESNQKTLTEADRAAALHLGDQEKHLILIQPPESDTSHVVLPELEGASARELGEAFQSLGMPRTAEAVVRARALLDGDRRTWSSQERDAAYQAMRQVLAARFEEEARATDPEHRMWARDVESHLADRSAQVGLGRLDHRSVGLITKLRGLPQDELLEEEPYVSGEMRDYYRDELARRGPAPAPSDEAPENGEIPFSGEAPPRAEETSAADTGPAGDIPGQADGAEQDEQDEEEEERFAAPDGYVYADEVRVGDTVAEVTWRAPAQDGRLQQGGSVYANPAGPARLGPVERETRTVVAVQPAMGGDGVKLVLDDGTSLTRRNDALVRRGTPAEVAEDGRRVGEWVPNSGVSAGDWVRFPAGTPTLPTRLDRASHGLGRTERLTVEGRVVRRTPGQPAAVLAEVTLTRADGTVVEVDADYSFALPRRVVRLDSSRPTAAPSQVMPGDLHGGDRITTPDGDVQVDAVEAFPEAGVVIAQVRDDEDRRAVHALQQDRPVPLAGAVPDSPPPEPGPEPVLEEAAALPDGTPSGRVRLRTDQRRRLLDLNLDAGGGDAPPQVRQAAARLRARQELSAEQMQALAAHLRALAGDDGQPGARRRSLARTASWVDASYARLEGFPPPPHDPHRDAPEKAHARNLAMGDVIAVPDDDGNVRFATVTVVRPVQGFGMVAVHLRHRDGSVEQRVLPDGVDLWVLPDLPEDVPEPPAGPQGVVREHLTADRVAAGDHIRWDGDVFADPIWGTVIGVRRLGGEFAAVRQYEVTVADGDDQVQSFTVSDRGWPSLVRDQRGAASMGQPYDAVMPDETDAPHIGWRDLAVGDRARVDIVTGTVVGLTRHPEQDDTPEGVTVTMLSDSGEMRYVTVLDDPARPDDVVDTTVTRLIPADGNAAARLAQEQGVRARITAERQFTALLADQESSRSRWAATEVRDAVRALPGGSSRETVVAAALERLEQVETRDDNAGAALAARLGAGDPARAEAMTPAARAITDAIKRRATGRIRDAVKEADLLPGETWPRAVARIADSYRNHPPSQGVVGAGASLARLRARLDDRPTPGAPQAGRIAALPDGADLGARLAAYRAVLPEDLADLGRHPVTRTTFDDTTLEDLEAGKVPAVRTTTMWVTDRAADDGPGERAMTHLAALRAAGRDVDVRYQHHLSGRDAVISAELETVLRRRGEAYAELDAADWDVVQRRDEGRRQAAELAGHDDFASYQEAAPERARADAARVEQSIPQAMIERREAAGRRWQEHARREAQLRGMLATARRDALIATLAEIRPLGGEGIVYTDRSGKPMTGRAGSNAAALRYAEQALPADWVAAARDLGPVEVVSGRGQHRYDPDSSRTQISLPADKDTALAYRDGAAVRVAVPSSQPGGVPRAGVAAHELGHRMEVAVPGLVAAEWLLHFDRTSSGQVGSRVRPEPVTGWDDGSEFVAYPGDFPHPYSGRVYRDGEAYEVFTSAFESLAGGRDSADDDLRQWGLGVLALLGTGKDGPPGGSGAAARGKGRDVLEGVNVEELTDAALRGLLGRISDPQARERLRAELDARDTSRRPAVDVSALTDDELLAELDKGWASYGEDPAVTALVDRITAELETREAARKTTPPPDAVSAPARPAGPVSPQGLETDIRLAYHRLAPEPGQWVSLRSLRELLGDTGEDPQRRREVDEMLISMNRRAPDVNFVPDSNQKTLTPQDRAAAVHFGDQDKHLLSITGEPPAPATGIDGVAEADLPTMDTDTLAGVLTRNWPRYDSEPQVAAMLDSIMAELDARHRERLARRGDPYAGVDLAALPDEELEALHAQHAAAYDSDPDAARLVKRIFAEFDARDLAKSSEPVSEEDRAIDALIAQGWTPRDAYAEVHGLDVEEMERQERQALVDAERQSGERREDTVRRMYRQWVHEQWLAAEQATRGYLLNRAGIAAGIDPQSLWGGNRARAGKYASEELKRWWAEQPNGGRMTYAEWRAQWLGDQADRRQARERRQSTSGKDFGL
ncbi:hypothetical protein GCM10017673_37740 [Streptosporangium violaceochromogenes]|nr:hypothetical protein GCM10017673_37740 [Streptosporangium violaceochromogenes]